MRGLVLARKAQHTDMTNWTREETLIAFNLYGNTPFGRLDRRNPEVIQVAALLGRTPSALAMKMVNLASLDPQQRARGVVGLGNASQMDTRIWREFEADPADIILESEQLMVELLGAGAGSSQVREPSPGSAEEGWVFQEGRDVRRPATARLGQGPFRRFVLAAYENTCCMTGIDIPKLLVASHIMPWASHSSHRLDPRNGLCLNALHDRAFDQGLISVDPGYTIRVSTQVLQAVDRSERAGFLAESAGSQISLPNQFAPNRDFLDYHHRNIFIDSRA